MFPYKAYSTHLAGSLELPLGLWLPYLAKENDCYLRSKFLLPLQDIVVLRITCPLSCRSLDLGLEELPAPQGSGNSEEQP